MRLATIPAPAKFNGLCFFEGDSPKNLNTQGEVQDVQQCLYSESPECWEEEYWWDDVHCLCYDFPGLDYCYRVNKVGVKALEAKGIVPMMNWVHFELDHIGHATWESLADDQGVDSFELFQYYMEKILTLGIPELEHVGIYQTRGGVHLVWPLSKAIPVQYANSFLQQFFEYLSTKGLGSIGMVFDNSCAQWTRAMRMPRACRDGNVLDFYRNFDFMSELSWEAPKELVLDQLGRVASISGTVDQELVRPPDEVFNQLRGLKCYEAVLHGKTLPESKKGPGRNNAMMAAIGEIGARLDTFNPNDIYQILAPSLLAEANNDGQAPSLDLLQDRCVYNCQNRAGNRELEVEEYRTARELVALEYFVSTLTNRVQYLEQTTVLAQVFDSMSPTWDYQPRVQQTVILPVMEETEKIDITEFDGAFATATKVKALVRELILMKDPDADVSWIRKLECVCDKKSKDGDLAAKGGIKASQKNIVLILQHDPRWKEVLFWNEMLGDIAMSRIPAWPSHLLNQTPDGKKGEWMDTDFGRLAQWFNESEYNFLPNENDIIKGVMLATQVVSKHPVREYLRTLVWDGVPRLDRMLADYFECEDTPFASNAGRCWLIAAVSRAMQPGEQCDTCLILGGVGGLRKSTSVRALLPNRDWAFDSVLPIGQKEAYENLRGTWLVELPELSGMDRKERANAKAFLTSTIDKYRPSYGKRVVAFPRMCIVYATTNDQHFLSDDDGNRRYWTVTVLREINIKRIQEIRDQLWAEAVVRYEAGEPWYFNTEQEKEAQNERSTRTVMHPWADILLEALVGKNPIFAKLRKQGYASTSTILKEILEIPAKDMRAGQDIEIAHAMRHVGWINKRCMIDGIRTNFWLDPKHAETPKRMMS